MRRLLRTLSSRVRFCIFVVSAQLVFSSKAKSNTDVLHTTPEVLFPTIPSSLSDLSEPYGLMHAAPPASNMFSPTLTGLQNEPAPSFRVVAAHRFGNQPDQDVRGESTAPPKPTQREKTASKDESQRLNKRKYLVSQREAQFPFVEFDAAGCTAGSACDRGPPDSVLTAQRNKEIAKLERILYMVVVDAGSTKTNANLWSTTVITEANRKPTVNWTRMRILANLGNRQNLRSFYTKLLSKGSQEAVIESTAALLAPIFAAARREIMKLIEGAQNEDLVLSDIPVIVHSTAGLRDMDAVLRQDLFRAINFVINGALEADQLYNNLMPSPDKVPRFCPTSRIKSPLRTRFQFNVGTGAGSKTKVMRFFTTPRYCRAITGIEEAVFTFITANIATGVIQNMRTDVTQKRRLGGILEVGGASMQVVFPVENQIHNGPLGTLDLTKNNRFLRRDLFPSMVEEFNVFGTSYMNLGINRALALLLKQYCQKQKPADGRCKSPCFQRGWRQTCVPGTPRVRSKKPQSPDESPFELDEEGRVIMEGNNLLDVANYCRKNNPLLRNITPRSDCRRAGFNLNFADVNSRAQIHDCIEIEGTGDMPACFQIISDMLFGSELPGNQETLSETGAAAPAEIGQFMAPKGVLYVVGNSLVFPILQLKEWKMLRTAYHEVGPNDTRRCDFTHLEDAARLLCSLKLSKSHSFVNPITQKTITLDSRNSDYCYKSVYAIALLYAINVKKGDVQVQFEAKIKHVESHQVLDFGWTYGAITNLILNPRFVSDLFALGPKFYRSSYRPVELVVRERIQSFRKQNQASLDV